jgi:hypothetical protein
MRSGSKAWMPRRWSVGGAVEEDRVLLDHLLEDVPHLGALLLDELLGALDRGDETHALPACCR